MFCRISLSLLLYQRFTNISLKCLRGSAKPWPMEEIMENKTLIYDVEENPKKKSEWVLFAIQHILAMLVACITVPSLTGLPIGSTLVTLNV